MDKRHGNEITIDPRCCRPSVLRSMITRPLDYRTPGTMRREKLVGRVAFNIPAREEIFDGGTFEG